MADKTYTLKSIVDLSFAGSVIVIDGIEIRDFIDDKSPVEFQDVEVSNIEWSCNGRMIRTVKPSAVMMSVTVIPGSMSDSQLRKMWKQNMCNGGSVDLSIADKDITCSIKTMNENTPDYTFTHGTMVSGPPSTSVNAQGKMGGNTYTFAFEGV